MYFRSLKRITLSIALAAFLPLGVTAEDEIEIHRGEEFTSPGAGHNEVLHFARVFTVSLQKWNQQPWANPRAKPPLSMEKALELAEASLEPSDTAGSDNLHVIKIELCKHPRPNPSHLESNVAFYAISFQVNDNEVQRVVLMDGTVLKPELTRIPTVSKEKR